MALAVRVGHGADQKQWTEFCRGKPQGLIKLRSDPKPLEKMPSKKELRNLKKFITRK